MFAHKFENTSNSQGIFAYLIKMDKVLVYASTKTGGRVFSTFKQARRQRA